MWRYPWMFWLVHRWNRWAGPGYGGREVPPDVAKRLEDQATTVDVLESRVAQLEERLDFTERLLAGRSTTAAT